MYMYIYTSTYIHVHTCIHTHTYIHTYIQHTYMYIHTYIHVHTCIHTHIYIHTYIHTHAHIYIYILSIYIMTYISCTLGLVPDLSVIIILNAWANTLRFMTCDYHKITMDITYIVSHITWHDHTHLKAHNELSASPRKPKVSTVAISQKSDIFDVKCLSVRAW